MPSASSIAGCITSLSGRVPNSFSAALIKRPVLDTGNKLLVGFAPETYASELK